MERRAESFRRELLERVKARVADRIRSVCTHMSDGEFDALVTRIAQVEIKYSTRRAEDLFNVDAKSRTISVDGPTSPPAESPAQEEQQPEKPERRSNR
jgi:hypothetical protein